MPTRASNADIAVFNLGSDYIPWLKSANFDWELALVACAGINNRYETMLETKRMLTFDASMNRKVNSGGACQTAKSVTTLNLGTSVLGAWESLDINYQNAHSRSDAGGDVLGTVQLHRPTSVSGSVVLMTDQAEATLISELIDAGFSPAVSFSYADSAGTFTVATTIKRAGKQWPESGIIMQPVSFEGGTISSGGGGLFATGATGTGAVNFAASDGGDPMEGTAVILSGGLKVSRDGRVEETYKFHVNSVETPV